MTTIHPRVLELAPDLTVGFPRSPRAMLAGYIVTPRAIDKCRAELAGKIGPYTYDGFMDNLLFGFAGFSGAELKEFIATGAEDEAIADWMAQRPIKRPRVEIIKWNNEWRYKRISEMPDRFQQFFERYIPSVLSPEQTSQVTYLFDVFDLEERRIAG